MWELLLIGKSLFSLNMCCSSLGANLRGGGMLLRSVTKLISLICYDKDKTYERSALGKRSKQKSRINFG